MVGRDPPQAPAPGQATLLALRDATRSRHGQIESLTALAGPFGLPHFHRLVQGFHAFHSAWEPAMARRLPRRLQPWFDAGRRLPLLQRDVQALHLPALAAAPPLPRLDGLPQLLGSLYVLEGSALGGQVVAGQLQQRFGMGPDQGAAYFHGQGRATGTRWRQFRELLADELDGQPASHPLAAQGAVATFDSLIALFQHLLHEPAAA